MSVTGERQRAEIARGRRSRLSIASSGSPRTRSIVSPPDLQTLHGPSSTVSHDGVVFAVCQTEGPEPIPGRTSCDRARHHRLVQEDVCDEMLLKNVAEGDKAAMHIIFARHRERVSRFIRRLVRNPVIVDDLVNQVFLDVWRSANRFEHRARVATWLFSIARFKAIGSWRERTLEDIDQDDALGIADTSDTPDVALDHKETQGILRACIDQLSPAHREIIDLFYYGENSVAEVSGIIGIPVATVKSRIFYARKRLARILMDAGFDATAARTSFDLPFTYAADKVPPAM